MSVGKDKLQGGRCIVLATMFAEPDRNTSKPVVNRWFGRADGVPREWQGDVGTRISHRGLAEKIDLSNCGGVTGPTTRT